jgi:hypothetical protein
MSIQEGSVVGETAGRLPNRCFAVVMNVSGLVLDVFLLSLFVRHLQQTLPVRRCEPVHIRPGRNRAGF